MKNQHLERLTDDPAPPVYPPRHECAMRQSRRSARAEVVSYSDDRRVRGLRALAEITGESGERVVERLRDIAPDFADWIIDFSYGDVMARPGSTAAPGSWPPLPR